MNLHKLISGISFLSLTGIGMMGCKPESLKPESLASFAVTNVAPGSPQVDVIVDGKITSASRLSYGNTTVSVPGATTIYLPIYSGQRSITVSKDTGRTASLADLSADFATGKSYTIFLLDSVMNGKARAIRVMDDLSLPTAGSGKVRFFHFAPAQGPVDVTFARGTTDSITLANVGYAGTGTPDASFRNVPAGSYTVKLKQPGTQTVLLSSTATITAGRIYTFFVRGGAMAQPLSIASSINY